MRNRRLKVLCVAILASACVSATGADLSRWHEVQGGAWRVDASLLPAIQSQMQESADAWARASSTRQPIDLSTYVVQFQGQRQWHWLSVTRVVEVWGICKASAASLPAGSFEERFQIVDDGGPCYFSATFDMDTRRLTGFLFNGPY